MGIPLMITWSFDGKQVAIEGSWDDWRTRFDICFKFFFSLSLSVQEISYKNQARTSRLMKVLPSGVYHNQLIVDGQWRYSPELMSVMSWGISFMFLIYR
ncbi:hypothetical protein RHSIM_Rhsim02G0200200 [Rhododendron simsii]|uniref:AMP-activated protein kinase glycogen-binding domain-containing protein n=1 Tax=Rhododendron simsii TaxID=118357 RepID=A0A834HGH0_RHOSS|nr:hypothetical protein RHSIM_Rhsim02G0200200 [Rhododendron simsii]